MLKIFSITLSASFLIAFGLMLSGQVKNFETFFGRSEKSSATRDKFMNDVISPVTAVNNFTSKEKLQTITKSLAGNSLGEPPIESVKSGLKSDFSDEKIIFSGKISSESYRVFYEPGKMKFICTGDKPDITCAAPTQSSIVIEEGKNAKKKMLKAQ